MKCFPFLIAKLLGLRFRELRVLSEDSGRKLIPIIFPMGVIVVGGLGVELWQ